MMTDHRNEELDGAAADGCCLLQGLTSANQKSQIDGFYDVMACVQPGAH